MLNLCSAKFDFISDCVSIKTCEETYKVVINQKELCRMYGPGILISCVLWVRQLHKAVVGGTFTTTI